MAERRSVDELDTPVVAELRSFGALLRRLRVSARLTQEQLADRAGLSVHSISNLERAVLHVPRAETVSLLARALRLSPEDERLLDAAARQAAIAHAQRQAESRARPTPAGEFLSPAGLPLPPSPLVGRASDMVALRAVLAREDARLVSIIGPPGVGKTRLALEMAWEAQRAGTYPDGIAFVDLSPLDDASLVPETITARLGLTLDRADRAEDTLAAAVHDARMLLLLDNFEHVLPAALCVADLLSRCPGPRVLVTSRVALRLRAEHSFPLAPLPLADPSALPPPKQLAQVPAIQLFVRRAQAARPDFRLTPANAESVAALCAILDGLPLALELAATALRVAPVERLLAQLRRGTNGEAALGAVEMDALPIGARDLPPRQQTLRAALDWSYGLLAPAEREVFRRLGVFVGGCTLQAAALVCATSALDAGASTDGAQAIEATHDAHAERLARVRERLSALIEHHLVLPFEADDGTDAGPDPDLDAQQSGPRVRLLETVRAYALEQLEAAGEIDGLRRAHAMHYLGAARVARLQLIGPDKRQALERFDAERHNLRAALSWAIASDQLELGFQLGEALWQYWYTRGSLAEGLAWLDRLLALDHARGEIVSARVRAIVLHGAASLARRRGDLSAAIAYAEASLTLKRTLGEPWLVSSELRSLGIIYTGQGDYAHAARYYEESLAIIRSLADDWPCSSDQHLAIERYEIRLASALMSLGALEAYQGHYERALAHIDEAEGLFQRMGDAFFVALCQGNRGCALAAAGELAPAERLLRQGLAYMRIVGDLTAIAEFLGDLAGVLRWRGAFAEAETANAEALALKRKLGDRPGMAMVLAQMAELACDQQDEARALHALRESLGHYRQGARHRQMAVALDAAAHIAALHGRWSLMARWCGAAAAVREARGESAWVPHQRQLRELLARARAALGETAYETSTHAGRALSFEAAVAEAEDALRTVPDAPHTPNGRAEGEAPPLDRHAG